MKLLRNKVAKKIDKRFKRSSLNFTQDEVSISKKKKYITYYCETLFRYLRIILN